MEQAWAESYCTGEHDLHVFLVNEELSRYCDSCSTLCKSKLEENLKNKFFDLVLVTFGPHAFFFGLDTTSLTLYR